MPVAGAEHPQPPAGHGQAGSWGWGTSCRVRVSAPRGLFLCGDHNRKQRALVSSRGLRGQPGPTSLEGWNAGSFLAPGHSGRVQGGGRARLGGLHRVCRESLKRAHRGQRGKGPALWTGGCCPHDKSRLGRPCARRGTSRPVGSDKDYGHARLVTMKSPVTSNDKP